VRQTGAKRHPCCFRRSLPKEQDSLGESRDCFAASGGSSKQWSAWIWGSKDFAVTSSGALFHPHFVRRAERGMRPVNEKGIRHPASTPQVAAVPPASDARDAVLPVGQGVRMFASFNRPMLLSSSETAVCS
jgi:hypothetical protein